MFPPPFVNGGGEIKKEENMKSNFYLIGIGGYGIRLAEEVCRKMKQGSTSVFSIAVDTDSREIKQVDCDYMVDLSLPTTFSYEINRLYEEGLQIFNNDEDLGYMATLPMDKGANMLRIKAMVSFIAYMNNEENKQKFNKMLDNLSLNEQENNFYILSSLCGGTGSALIVPLTLYIKNFLREKGVKNAKFTLHAVCPDILTEGLNSELRVKAHANTYATLTELNTVNTVAMRRGKSNYKIGFDKGKSFGLLFDATNSKFHLKNYAPFEKIYMFDRMPGIFSPELHLNIISDYIENMSKGLCCEREKETFNNLSIYNAYNAIQIQYPVDDISSYIAKYETAKALKNECVKFYKEIESFELPKTASLGKKTSVDYTEQFAKKVQTFFENLEIGKGERTSYVLDRQESQEKSLIIDDDYWLTNFSSSLTNTILEGLKNENFENIFNKLQVQYVNTKEKISLDDFTERVDNLYRDITNYFTNELKTILSSQDIEQLILKGDKQSSIIEGVLKEDGFIHPVLALIRLSELYLKLKSKEKAYCSLEEDDYKNSLSEMKIPNKLLQLQDCETSDKGYGKLGDDRFIRVVAKINKNKPLKKLNFIQKIRYSLKEKAYKISNAKTDEKYVLSDFNLLLEGMLSEFMGLTIKKVLLYVEKLIDGYRRTLKDISIYYPQFETDVLEAQNERKTQGVYYGIKTSKEEKENARKEYLNTIKSQGFQYSDNLLGESTFSYVLGQLGKPCTDSLKPIQELIEKFSEKSLERLKSSTYYNEMSEKNVFSSLIEPTFKQVYKSTLKGAFMLTPNLLTHNEHEQKVVKTIFVSPSTAEYILSKREELKLKARTREEAVDEFVTNMGEYDSHIKILDNIEDKKAYVVAEKFDISLSSISKINGDDFIAIYKKDYVKAINNVTKYSSKMWNPHIFDVSEQIEMIKI